MWGYVGWVVAFFVCLFVCHTFIGVSSALFVCVYVVWVASSWIDKEAIKFNVLKIWYFSGWTEVEQLCGGSSWKTWKDGWQPYKAHSQVHRPTIPLRCIPYNLQTYWIKQSWIFSRVYISLQQPTLLLFSMIRCKRSTDPVLHEQCSSSLNIEQTLTTQRWPGGAASLLHSPCRQRF